jgi:hypothetical protein
MHVLFSDVVETSWKVIRINDGYFPISVPDIYASVEWDGDFGAFLVHPL